MRYLPKCSAPALASEDRGLRSSAAPPLYTERMLARVNPLPVHSVVLDARPAEAVAEPLQVRHHMVTLEK